MTGIKRLEVLGVDVSHSRLVELAKLADQAKPFYEWIEMRFQRHLSRSVTLDAILKTASKRQIETTILDCYSAQHEANLPLLFDGVGRNYAHLRACYYMFSWLIRDAPQQRLGPLIQRMVSLSKKSRTQVEAEVLSALIHKYRGNVRTFEWPAVREVIIDRLEGSRRSIRGHEKEVVVRTALSTAIQAYFQEHGNYGLYTSVELAVKSTTIGNETFDVSANLMDAQGKCVRRILAPIKTRETEGGGHAHLFTRDIKAAMRAAKNDNPQDILVAVVVARNWSEREKVVIRGLVDYAALFSLSPNDFTEFPDNEQSLLNDFIAQVLASEGAAKTISD